MKTVAHFDIPFQQILNEAGEILNPIPPSLKNKATLLDLYRLMVRTRIFDKKAIALQRTGKMGTYAPINGQEAISTAIGHSMQANDLLIPYYRDYAAQFQRGVKMSEILAYWGGDERGSRFVHQKEDLPISVPIASQCLHAAGVAFAFKYRKEARVALTSVGDGGTSEGDFYEAMNVAGTWKLPVVFVVNNNQWAISVPLAKQTACQTLAQKAIAAGFEGIQVDGNDVLALCEVIGSAIAKARKGEGPTLIEAVSYRLSDHTTADDASRYQPESEVNQAALKEPILRFKKYLEKEGFWDEKQELTFIQESTELVQKEIDVYLQSKAQTIDSAFDYHFATLPDYLIEQRARALEESSHA